MSTKEAIRLKRLKALDLSKANASFWVVKRTSAPPLFKYSVLRVDIDAKLGKRLKGYMKSQFQDRELPLEPYDFNTADPDDKLLTLDSDGTDFEKVQAEIDSGFDNGVVKEYSQLLGSWAYVVLFEVDGKRAFAWRKISNLNTPTAAKSRKTLYFIGHKLVDADDQKVFVIDPRFDFFVFDGTAFIGRKAAFETSMNFREGMKQKSAELLDAFKTLNFLSDVEPIRSYVGENLHHLRKIAAIKNAGYYNEPDYIAKLMKVVKIEKWDLKIRGGKIIVEDETIELLLKLLNNDRLRSPITDQRQGVRLFGEKGGYITGGLD